VPTPLRLQMGCKCSSPVVTQTTRPAFRPGKFSHPIVEVAWVRKPARSHGATGAQVRRVTPVPLREPARKVHRVQPVLLVQQVPLVLKVQLG